MTDDLRLTHGTHVIVCDGRKALLLRNAGDATLPNLVVEQVFEAPENPASREHVSDGPGKQRNRYAPASAVQQADPHQRAEDAFVAEAAGKVNGMCAKSGIERLVVVAAPRALSTFRGALDATARQRIVAEVDKDLTKHPVAEIEKLLVS